jgi:hypothetical protein
MKIVTLAAVLSLLALSTVCSAVSLAPGQTLVPNAVQYPQVPNQLVPGSFYTDFPYPSSSIQTHLLLNGYQNTDTLDTLYVTELAFRAPVGISGVTLHGYQGVTVDAGYIPVASAVIPTLVSRSADGDTITWTFNGFSSTPNPSDPSTYGWAVLLMLTDSHSSALAPQEITFVDSSAPNGIYTYATSGLSPHAAVTAPIPELSSLSALLLGAGSLALRYRRRV